MTFDAILGAVVALLAVVALVGVCASLVKGKTGFVGFLFGLLICFAAIVGGGGSFFQAFDKKGQETEE